MDAGTEGIFGFESDIMPEVSGARKSPWGEMRPVRQMRNSYATPAGKWSNTDRGW